MSDNNQELFFRVPFGTLDVKYRENGIVHMYRNQELIAESDESLDVDVMGAITAFPNVYETLNTFSVENPNIPKEALIEKAKELILWEQIHGED